MTNFAEPRKRPGQDRSKQTVEAIIEAGARILIEAGYSRLTTNKVAQLAGVSIGSLYQYFSNKDALVFAIYERHQARVAEAMTDAFNLVDNLAEQAAIRRLIATVLEAHTVEPTLRARFESLRQEGSFPFELGEGELGKIVGKLKVMLHQTMGLSSEDAHLSAWILVTTVHTLIEAFERRDLQCDSERQIDEITQMVYGYVSVLKQGARASNRVHSQ